MNRPTEAEVRAEPATWRLNAWVEWLVFGRPIEGPVTPGNHCQWYVLLRDGGRISPRAFDSDAAASAELEQFLWASGEFAEIETRIIDGYALVTLEPPTGDSWFANHSFDTDPVHARRLALAKAALLWRVEQPSRTLGHDAG